MSHAHLIDPLNRIEGDMAIEVKVDDDNIVEDSRVLGYVYRGFENVFIGRKPFDAMRLSQRSCGVCPVSHGTAGAYAIESMSGCDIPRNAELVRDIVLGANIVVSHATHFYFMWGPDLVDKAYQNHSQYNEIVQRFDPLKSPHLKNILKSARIPLHSVVATFGGKFPHPMHAVPGGVACTPKHIEVIKAHSMLEEVKGFVENDILNGITCEEWMSVKSAGRLLDLMSDDKFASSDVGFFVKIGQDLGLNALGEGTGERFLAYGFGHNVDGSMLFKPGFMEKGKYHELDPSHINEDTKHSYYEDVEEWLHPSKGVTKPLPNKQDAYTWIKAPRYVGHPVEAGPLARQMVNQDPLITDLVAKFGINTFTRTIARLHEIVVLIPSMLGWVGEMDLSKPMHNHCEEVESGEGTGLVEAPRGALGHWISVEKGLCTRYQIITPTTWNASPRDSTDQPGAIEKALTGIRLRDKDSMVEVGHVVRSFDPCISCSIHAVSSKHKSIRIDHVHG
jgi:hydrogenase large subunit